MRRLYDSRKRILVTVALAAAFDSRVQRIKRKRQPLHGHVDATVFRGRVHEFQKAMLRQTLTPRILRAAK